MRSRPPDPTRAVVGGGAASLALEPVLAVSVVIPMRNEERYIGPCLQSVLNNNYPRELLEVLIVDGHSDDRSREIVNSIAAEHPNVILLENPRRITPVAMNLGIRASRGEVIVILGAHGYVAPDFVRRAVTSLNRHPEAACVGGIRHNIAEGLWGQGIALAVHSRFGVGNARYLTGGRPGFVDTVWAGAYRRTVFERIGVFDERFVRNQDDEFNYRLTLSGGKIYFDPSIQSHYIVRGSVVQLWRQYFQYGYWKTRLLAKHRMLPSWRHVVPSALVVAFVVTIAISAFTQVGWNPPSLLLGAYLAGASLAAGLTAVRNGWRFFFVLPVAFAAIHLGYGCGFLDGLRHLTVRGVDTGTVKHTELTR